MTKDIELSQGKKALVDDDDFEWLDKYYWVARRDRVTTYAVGSLSRKPSGVIDVSGRRRRPKGIGTIGKLIPMHRFLLNAPDDMEVDHINGDGLDNRRPNLRLVSRAENLQNRRLFRNNKLGHKGISFDSRTGRYVVFIRTSYASLEEAIRERNRVFRFVYGDHFNETSAQDGGSTPTSDEPED